MHTLYGIKNCDTVKKARHWLEQHGTIYRFHDYRQDGLGRDLLVRLEAGLGWDTMLNRRGTTWRALPEAEREPMDRDKAIDLMLAHPAIIKRPILDTGSALLIGFNADRYASTL